MHHSNSFKIVSNAEYKRSKKSLIKVHLCHNKEENISHKFQVLSLISSYHKSFILQFAQIQILSLPPFDQHYRPMIPPIEGG